MILVIWGIAVLCALPYPLHTGVYIHLHDPNTGQPINESLYCNIMEPYKVRMTVVLQTEVFLLFIFPMAIITVLYVLIGLALKKANVARQSSTEVSGISSTNPATANSRKVVKMLGE